jgi:protocatechuate 3,4-dioxygenase beta subunit
MTRLPALMVLSLLAVSSAGAREVEGFVYDTTGAPVAGARVSAWQPEASESRFRRWLSSSPQRTPVAAASSGEDGGFRLASLPESIVTIEATAPSGATNFSINVPGDLSPTITLPATRPFNGTVTHEGKPVAGATVVWARDDHEALAVTDASGRYSLPGVPQWATANYVFHPDFAPLLPTSERGQRDGGAGHLHQLEKGRTLRGRVVNQTGTPVAGARIAIDGIPIAVSDEEGAFTAAHLPLEAKRIEAHSDGRAGFAEVGPQAVKIVLEPARALEGMVQVKSARGAQPLAGAVVGLHPVREPGIVRTAVTNAEGRYVVEGLPPQRYAISTSSLEQRFRPDYSDRMSIEGEAANVADLTASGRIGHDIDLVRPVVVSGRVLDPSRKPVAGAAVVVAPQEVPDGHAPFDSSARRTAPDGSFSLPVIWTDGIQKMQVLVLRPAHSVARSEPFQVKNDVTVDVVLPVETEVRGSVIGPDGKGIAGAEIAFARNRAMGGYMAPTEVMRGGRNDRLVTGGSGEFVLWLEPGEYDFAVAASGFQRKTLSGREVTARSAELTIALDPGVSIRGRVVRNGRPVAGVYVNLMKSGRREEPRMTDAGGTFLLENLAPGSYDLFFHKFEEMVEERRTVHAPADSVLIELPPAGGVSGAVVDARTGQPVQSFSIEVQQASEVENERLSRQRGLHRQFRAEDGKFEIEALPGGEARLTAFAPGFVVSAPVVLNIEPGVMKGNVRITLDRGATLSGRITDPSGAPVAEAQVHAVPVPTGRPETRPHGGPPIGTTDADGSYSIAGIENGRIYVTIRKPGFTTVQREIDVEGATTFDAQLSRGLTLSGIVRSGGRAVPNVQIGATSSAIGSDHQGGVTDAGGRFTLSGLAPGLYTISAFSEDLGHTEVKSVDVEKQRELVIDLDKRERAVIYGRVLGMPLEGPGEKITLRRVSAMSNDHGSEAGIDAGGNFRIENAPAGFVRVVAHVETSGGGRSTPEKVIEVPAGSEFRVDLEFVEAIRLQGRVTLAGAPLPRARVVFMAGQGPSSSAISDEGGNYSLALPRAGTYNVNVHSEERAMRTHFQITRRFTASETFDIDIRETAVRGLVVDSSGAPMAQAMVSLLPAGAATPLISSQTDTRGRFSFLTAATGQAEVSAWAAGYAQQSRTVRIGDDAEIVLELQSAESLRVRVVEEGRGTPLEAYVTAREEGGRPVGSHAQRSPDGTHTFSLKEGRYVVTATVPNYGQRSVVATAPGSVEIGLTPGGELIVETAAVGAERLRLFNPAGVEVFPCCEQRHWPVQGAHTLIPSLAPGQYRVVILDGEGRSLGGGTAMVVAGQTVRLRL